MDVGGLIWYILKLFILIFMFISSVISLIVFSMIYVQGGVDHIVTKQFTVFLIVLSIMSIIGTFYLTIRETLWLLAESSGKIGREARDILMRAEPGIMNVARKEYPGRVEYLP